jgi:hypothetical protein
VRTGGFWWEMRHSGHFVISQLRTGNFSFILIKIVIHLIRFCLVIQINFPGPRLKIARAEQHIAELEKRIDDFFNENPHTVEIGNCPDSGDIVVNANFSGELPNDVATIIGDVIHNLRSALDLLVSDVVRQNGFEPSRNTGFPIYLDENGFNGGIDSKLKSAPANFVDFIKALKPYKSASDGSEGCLLLWTLAQLDNDDKHITLLPTIGLASLKNLKAVHKDGPEHGLVEIGEYKFTGQGLIGVLSIGGPSMKIEMPGNVEFSISLNHRELYKNLDIRKTLQEMKDSIYQIVLGSETINNSGSTKPILCPL